MVPLTVQAVAAVAGAAPPVPAVEPPAPLVLPVPALAVLPAVATGPLPPQAKTKGGTTTRRMRRDFDDMQGSGKRREPTGRRRRLEPVRARESCFRRPCE